MHDTSFPFHALLINFTEITKKNDTLTAFANFSMYGGWNRVPPRQILFMWWVHIFSYLKYGKRYGTTLLLQKHYFLDSTNAYTLYKNSLVFYEYVRICNWSRQTVGKFECFVEVSKFSYSSEHILTSLSPLCIWFFGDCFWVISWLLW